MLEDGWIGWTKVGGSDKGFELKTEIRSSQKDRNASRRKSPDMH